VPQKTEAKSVAALHVIVPYLVWQQLLFHCRVLHAYHVSDVTETATMVQ